MAEPGNPPAEKDIFTTRISKSWYMLSFAVQGVLSMMYGPLVSMIMLKYPAKEGKETVFQSHEELFVITAAAFMGMVLGFAVMIYTFIEAKDAAAPAAAAAEEAAVVEEPPAAATYPTSLPYQILSAFSFSCVIIAPAMLTVIALVPKDKKWIGYVVAGCIAATVAFITFLEPIITFFEPFFANPNPQEPVLQSD